MEREIAKIKLDDGTVLAVVTITTEPVEGPVPVYLKFEEEKDQLPTFINLNCISLVGDYSLVSHLNPRLYLVKELTVLRCQRHLDKAKQGLVTDVVIRYPNQLSNQKGQMMAAE